VRIRVVAREKKLKDQGKRTVSRTAINVVVMVTILALVQAQAAGVVIGLAVSSGPMTVDRAAVAGNANLSEGSALESGAAAARIQLSSGRRATLGPNSAAKVYGDHVALEKGLGLLGGGYKMDANGFRVEAEGGQAEVSLAGGTVRVAALSGSAKVRDAEGVVVARLTEGTALSVKAGAAGDRTSTMTGVLRERGGKYLLKDQVTNLDVELRGADVAKEVGRAIEVTGKATATADKESQIVEVARLTRVEGEQQSTGAAKPSGAPGTAQPSGGEKQSKKKPAGAAAGGGGMSKGAVIAIVVVGGGAAAGVGVWAATKDSNKSVSR
jgi:hypothetical protein